MISLDIQKKLLTADGTITLSAQLDIQSGEFISLFGKSGAGKTTLLRILAGLTSPDVGTIRVNGDTWLDTNRHINVPPQKRRIGFVFQDYALFPHLTVRQNLAFAADDRHDTALIGQLLTLTGLETLQNRKPDQLSGGQQQRVALARALARRPRILLLDEPLSALDAETRLKLQEELLTIHRQLGITTLIVSHDLSEVFKLSSRVLILERGQIVRSGTPADLFAGDNLSGHFRFSGELLDIQPNDVVFILSVLIGNVIVNVIATQEEIADLRVGDKIIVTTKAFNPIIYKLSSFQGETD